MASNPTQIDLPFPPPFSSAPQHTEHSEIHERRRSDANASPPSSLSRSSSTHPPIRAPTITHHSRIIDLTLPTPELVGSIASGAHYAGAWSPPPHTEGLPEPSAVPPKPERHKRSLSMSAEDPIVEEVYRDVMKDLEELFCGRPAPELFERRWHKDAQFEDPVCHCFGFPEYAARFYAMPKMFSQCKRIQCRILSATLKPNRLVLAQTQEYTFKWIGIRKTIESFVHVELDENLKIVRMVDQWNGDRLPTRFGALWLRKLNARVVSWFVRIPKPNSQVTQ